MLKGTENCNFWSLKKQKKNEEWHIMQISSASLPFQNSGNEIAKVGRNISLDELNSFRSGISISKHADGL